MELPLTKKQLDKFGFRVAKAGDVLAPDDLAVLQAVVEAHDQPLAQVAAVIGNLGYEPGTRLKALETILEKIRRDGTRLSTMQDIAGARVVVKGGRTLQDTVVRRISNRLAVERTVDRRVTPSFGYRAVHVIVRQAGFPVEIQVRTSLQDQWAQIFERTADEWGRQIRYGEPPNDPDREVFATWPRRRVVDSLGGLADRIADIEEIQLQYESLEATVDYDRLGAAAEPREGVEDELVELQRALRHAEELLRTELARLATIVGIERIN